MFFRTSIHQMAPAIVKQTANVSVKFTAVAFTQKRFNSITSSEIHANEKLTLSRWLYVRYGPMLLPTPTPRQAAWSNVLSFSVVLTVPLLVWVLSRIFCLGRLGSRPEDFFWNAENANVLRPCVTRIRLSFLLWQISFISRSVRPRVEHEGKDEVIVSHTCPVGFVMKAAELLVKEGYFGDQCGIHQDFWC